MIVKWFCDNFLKPNDDKFHLIIFGDKHPVLMADLS